MAVQIEKREKIMSEVTYVVRCAETDKPLAGFFTPCYDRETAFTYQTQLEQHGYENTYVVVRKESTEVTGMYQEREVFNTEVNV
jgi:hypothetical protein